MHCPDRGNMVPGLFDIEETLQYFENLAYEDSPKAKAPQCYFKYKVIAIVNSNERTKGYMPRRSLRRLITLGQET